MDYSRPERADRLAADYVLGSLRGPARRRFEALTAAHPALRDAVHDWQERLMPLSASVEPLAPPPAVWRRIEARLDGVAPAPLQRNPAPGWWQRLAFWRGLSTLAALAALTFAALVFVPGATPPPIIVVLSPAGAPDGSSGFASFVAGISADGGALVMRPVAPLTVQPGRSLELWALPAEGAPRSLGLVSAREPTIVQRGRLLEGTAALAVTLEPPGGSPTGAPTGPVLYSGKLVP